MNTCLQAVFYQYLSAFRLKKKKNNEKTFSLGNSRMA